MNGHQPISGDELEEMNKRCEIALHLPMVRMEIAVAHRREEFVGMAVSDSEEVGASLRDLPRCLAEIERLRRNLAASEADYRELLKKYEDMHHAE